MKKFFIFALGLIALCTLLSSCEMERTLEEITGEDVRPFDYERLQEAGKGWVVVSSGDSLCGMTATLEHPEETVTAENLGRATYSPMGDVREEVIDGILYVRRDFLGSDGNVLHVKAWAPETLAEKAGILGYVESYDLIADPVEVVSITENRATLKAVASMVFYRDNNEVGRVSVKPNYYHVTVKPDKPDEPDVLTVKADTSYFWSKGKAYFKIKAVYSDGTVLIDTVMPIAFYGGYYGTTLYNAVAPARLDETRGNNGKLDTVEPQPDRSYTEKVESSLISSSLSYFCFRVKRFIKGDEDGELKTHAVVDYWTKSYTFHDDRTGWSLTTWPITITNNIVRDEFEPQPELVGGKVADDYGREHNYLNTYWVGIRADLSINGGTYPFDEVGDGNIICSW